MTLSDIHPLVRDFKIARETLLERVHSCQEEQTAILRRKAPGIKSAAARTRDTKARLEAAIESHPELFRKPKTQTIEGIKIGFAKGRGKVIIGENASKLIQKHFPDRFDDLVKTTHKPIASSLQKLTAGELQRIGCQLIDTGDQVIITVPKDDLEKIVEALLEDAPENT
jgi:arsenate reductase-like glutaredoxin family protein